MLEKSKNRSGVLVYLGRNQPASILWYKTENNGMKMKMKNFIRIMQLSCFIPHVLILLYHYHGTQEGYAANDRHAPNAIMHSSMSSREDDTITHSIRSHIYHPIVKLYMYILLLTTLPG